MFLNIFFFIFDAYLAPAVSLQLLQSSYVSLCQIDNMDIIPHTWQERENLVLTLPTDCE